MTHQPLTERAPLLWCSATCVSRPGPLTCGRSAQVPVSPSFKASTCGGQGCRGICWLGPQCVEELGLGAEVCDLKPAGSGVPGSPQPLLTQHPSQCLSLPGGEPFRPAHPPTQPALTPSLCSTVFAKNFRVAAAMKTSVLLSWEVPDSYKSAVPFKVGDGHGQPSPHAGLLLPCPMAMRL